MRTLTRPMFNMGGPIKQGIMNGIREPYRDGGKMLLVGQHPKEFQDKSGREKHLAPLIGAGLWSLARMAARPFAKQVIKQIPKFQRMKWTPGGNIYSKGYPGGTGKATWEKIASKNMPTTPLKSWEPTKLGQWFQGDPLAGAAMTGKGLIGGAAKKGLQFGKYATTTPSGLLFFGAPVTIAGTKWLLSDGTELDEDQKKQVTQGPPGGGDPGMAYTKPGPTPKSKAERDAFAKSQREKRVNKYLDMMGYDRSKKMAIADALIDASKIVGERGTLDPKNINQ